MNDDEPNCWTCAYRDLPETAEPCASCDMYFSHFESTQATDTTASEDARRCSLCKFRDIPIVQSPCQRCAITPGLPCFTSDTNKLVEMEMMKREEAKREEAKRREAEMTGQTCQTCKYKGKSIEEEPCISCNGYQNYTPDESAPCAEGTDENDDVIEPCNTCTHRDNLRCNPPCSHCRQERGIEYPEYEEDKGDEGSTDSGVTEIVPKHIVDMFVERVGQEVRRHFEAHNAHPRPCPYCGEIPEVVGETIYPGEEHCYVVCNGAKLLPHSISIHGLTREEAVARWNSFVLTMKSQEK